MRLIVLATLFAPVCGLAQDMSSVEGLITSRATKQTIAGAAVTLRTRDGPVYETTTDNTGKYRITGLTDGDYNPSITKTGFYQETIFSSRIHVQGSGIVRHDFELVPWSIIRGRVLDPDGKPAPKVHVQINREEDEVVTDEDGLFAFEKVAPGYYRILAKPEPKIRIQEGQRIATVPTYSPSAAERTLSERILVGSRAGSTTYEVRLRSLPAYRVTGTVLDDAGKPAAKATVRLMSPEDEGTRPIATAFGAGFIMLLGPVSTSGSYREEARVVSAADGKFEFASVRAGTWRIQAESFPYLSTRNRDLVLTGGGSVNVPQVDTEDLEIRLAASFDLGVVLDSPPAPTDLDNVLFRILLSPLDGQQGPTMLPPEKQSNSFEDVLPGRYRIVARPLPLDSYVKSVLLEGREILGQEVNLMPGYPPLRISYGTAAKVRGTVENGEGSTVVLFPQSTESNKMRFIWTARCGSGGHFEIGGIVPGSYYTLAFNDVDRNLLPEIPFVSNIVAAATPLRVDQGSTVTVEPRVTIWPW